MKRIIAALAITLATTTFAEPAIRFDKKVEAYKSNGTTRSHRSGITNAAPSNAMIAARNSNQSQEVELKNFVIDTSTADPEFAETNIKIEAKGFKLHQDRSNRRYEATSYKNKKSLKIKDTATVETVADNLKRELFPASLLPQIDFYNYAIEYTQSGNTKPKATGYTYYYSRVHKGRVIRDGSSHIIVQADANGTITAIDISWPKIKEASTPKKYTNPDAVSEKHLRKQLAEIKEVSDGKSTIPLDEINVKGMSDSWCQSDSKGTFTPCASYLIEAKGANIEPVIQSMLMPISDN